MKKNFILLLLILFSAFLFSACSNDTNNTKYGPEFSFEGSGGVSIDSYMTIDGNADESVWAGKDFYTFTTSPRENYEITNVKTKVHFGEEGVYFYAEANDRFVHSYTSVSGKEAIATDKTGIQLYLCKTGVSANDNSWEIVLACDGSVYPRFCSGDRFALFPNSGCKYAVNLINPVLDEKNNGTMDGYRMEFFMPYNRLNLTEKPKTIKLSVASVRHTRSDGKSPRWWQMLIPGATTKNPNAWYEFCEDGIYSAPPAQDYTIDGDLSDWADYAGEEHFIDIVSVDGNGSATKTDTDPRYISNRFIKGSDGLYCSVEALLRKYFTDNTDAKTWWRNTNYEMRIYDSKKESYVLFQINATGYSNLSGVNSVWKCEDTDLVCNEIVENEPLKYITNEMFIHNETLANLGLNPDEDLYITWSFRNGKYQPSYATDNDEETDPGEFTVDGNETIIPVSLDANASQPFIFNYYGTRASNVGAPFRVTEKGIEGGEHNDERYVFDGKADEWADYDGAHALVVGRKPSDVELAGDASLANSDKKGFDVIARKGKDGVYFYATIKHSNWKTNDLQAHMNSNLAIAFGLTNVNPTEANKEGLTGREIFFMSTGVSNPAAKMWISDTGNAQKDANGVYTTVIEGFVPFNAMFNTLNEKWAEIFDVNTGEVKEGYSLRFGVQWRTREEKIVSQGRKSRNDWQAAIFWALPHNFMSKSVDDNDNCWRMYYLNESGLHTSAYEAKYCEIDGDASDWANYNGLNPELRNDNTGTFVNFKAFMRDDGLYFLATIKMKNYHVSNAFDSSFDNVGAQWYKNTYVALTATDFAVTGGNKAQLVTTPFVTTNGSGKTISPAKYHGADAVWNVKKEGEYYVSTVEVFFNSSYLLETMGVSNLPEALKVKFEYSSANTNMLAKSECDLNASESKVWSISSYAIGYDGIRAENSEITSTKNVSDATLQFEEWFDKNGAMLVVENKLICPIKSVSYNGEELVCYRDYVIEYYNNTDVGIATYKVIGRNDYYGEIEGEFVIYAKDVGQTVKVIAMENLCKYVTEGAVTEVYAPVVVYNGTEFLVEGTDYVLAYENIRFEVEDEGKYIATVTVTFINQYKETDPIVIEYCYDEPAQIE